jgi:hypothetical protein
MMTGYRGHYLQASSDHYAIDVAKRLQCNDECVFRFYYVSGAQSSHTWLEQLIANLESAVDDKKDLDFLAIIESGRNITIVSNSDKTFRRALDSEIGNLPYA